MKRLSDLLPPDLTAPPPEPAAPVARERDPLPHAVLLTQLRAKAGDLLEALDARENFDAARVVTAREELRETLRLCAQEYPEPLRFAG